MALRIRSRRVISEVRQADDGQRADYKLNIAAQFIVIIIMA